MKRSERHHLKDNEFAQSVARLTETFEERRREFIGAGLVVLVVALAVGGYFYWRHNVDAQSRAMLADAMAVADAPVVPPTPPAPPAQTQGATPAPQPTQPPPGSFPTERAKLEAALGKYLAAANAYPGSPAGASARFQAAATLAALGRYDEAAQRYQEVVDRLGKGLLADAARLGLANVKAQKGQYDVAIAAFRQLAVQKESSVPADGVLVQLARTYEQAGNRAEALKTYQRIVDEFPQSIYASVAQRELAAAKSSGVN